MNLPRGHNENMKYTQAYQQKLLSESKSILLPIECHFLNTAMPEMKGSQAE